MLGGEQANVAHKQTNKQTNGTKQHTCENLFSTSNELKRRWIVKLGPYLICMETRLSFDVLLDQICQGQGHGH